MSNIDYTRYEGQQLNPINFYLYPADISGLEDDVLKAAEIPDEETHREGDAYLPWGTIENICQMVPDFMKDVGWYCPIFNEKAAENCYSHFIRKADKYMVCRKDQWQQWHISIVSDLYHSFAAPPEENIQVSAASEDGRVLKCITYMGDEYSKQESLYVIAISNDEVRTLTTENIQNFIEEACESVKQHGVRMRFRGYAAAAPNPLGARLTAVFRNGDHEYGLTAEKQTVQIDRENSDFLFEDCYFTDLDGMYSDEIRNWAITEVMVLLKGAEFAGFINNETNKAYDDFALTECQITEYDGTKRNQMIIKGEENHFYEQIC